MQKGMKEVTAFETYVRESGERILQEAGEFFMQRGNVFQAMRELAKSLDEAHIPYAVTDTVALGQHGMARMTLDIDILLTSDGLREFKARYPGRGYVPAFPGAEKSFRAAETGVRIEVLTTGEYPGDGLPKPVRFPDPREASVEMNGVRFITPERLVELKLASGMTAPHRLRDLADVQDLIRALHLPADFAARLDASVRPTYAQLWSQAQAPDRLQEE
jgi:hypothetical protein